MRPAEQGSGLGRLRGRVGSLLDDVRAARRRRRGSELHLSRAAARTRREDGLLGDEPAQRVGTPNNPIDPNLVEDWADRVFYRAVASSSCATPWIALNEMFGSNLATPWSPTNTQYRDNVLQFVRRLKRARRTSVPAAEQPPLHRRRSRRLVAPGRALHQFRARGLFRRAADLSPGPGARLAEPAERLPPGSHRPDLDRDPRVEDRHLPRLPHEPGPGRPRAPRSLRARGSTRSSGRCSRSSRSAARSRWRRSGPGAGASGLRQIAIPTSRPPLASTSGRATTASAQGRRWPGAGSTSR